MYKSRPLAVPTPTRYVGPPPFFNLGSGANTRRAQASGRGASEGCGRKDMRGSTHARALRSTEKITPVSWAERSQTCLARVRNTPGVCPARVVRATRVVRVWQACYVSHTCHAGPVRAAYPNDALRCEVVRCARPASAALCRKRFRVSELLCYQCCNPGKGLQVYLELHGAVTGQRWGFMPYCTKCACGTELSRTFVTGNILSFPGTFAERS